MKRTTNRNAVVLLLAGLAAVSCGTSDPQASDQAGSAGSPGSAGESNAPSTGGSNGSTGTSSGAGGNVNAAAGSGGGGGGDMGSGGNGGARIADGGASDGTSGDGWVSIMPIDETLKDARGVQWFPYVKGYAPGMDPLKTYRFDPATGYLVVRYDNYPGMSFDTRLGLLYYDKKLTNYKVRIEYSFQEPQAKNPVGWGKNNSGLFVFCTDPHTITGNPDFPTGIEIQILGNPSTGGSVNCQICLNSTVGMYPAKIGGKTITGPGGCFPSTQDPTDFQPAANWVTVEADVSATGTTNIYQLTQDGKLPATPIQTISTPVKTGAQTVTDGWLSLQSESQPCNFRKVELMELAQ